MNSIQEKIIEADPSYTVKFDANSNIWKAYKEGSSDEH